MFLSVLLSSTFPDQSHGTCVVGTEQLDEEQSHTLAEWDTGQSYPIEPVLVTALPLDTAPELFTSLIHMQSLKLGPSLVMSALQCQSHLRVLKYSLIYP